MKSSRHPLGRSILKRCGVLQTTLAPLVIAGGLVIAQPSLLQALRVCADPDYPPFSNRAGEGFENKIAEAIAAALGEKVEYTFANSRGHGGFPQFLANTLDANKCDVVMNIPYGSREELTTRPYYVSSYVFVFEKSRNYDIKSMDAPALKRVKIGFERETPVETALKIRSMLPGAVGFDIAEDTAQSPAAMLDALKAGKIDVLITWQPAIGYFLRHDSDLEVVAVPNERALGSPEQYAFPMSMGVRAGNVALKERLDDAIRKHEAELAAILAESGVKLYTPVQ